LQKDTSHENRNFISIGLAWSYGFTVRSDREKIDREQEFMGKDFTMIGLQVITLGCKSAVSKSLKIHNDVADVLYLAHAFSWPPVSNNIRDSCPWTQTDPGFDVTIDPES
jgi:hypothetical protein